MAKKWSRIFWLPLLLLGLSGCTSTIHRPFSVDTDPATSLSVDARQRIILVTDKGGTDGNRRVVCAEPSPDVFSALAATAAARANVGTEGGELASSIAEQAAAVGPRTQTVQLLRDGLYRACEAYMNGILDAKEYRRIVLGYDETMLTLLTIDGLTSRPQELPVLRTGSSTATVEEGSASAGVAALEIAGDTAGAVTPSSDAQLAQTVHEILKSYYQFQLDLKRLFRE